jgi:hypothetical protein
VSGGSETVQDPMVLILSRGQLDAYNRADLDAFCACYHPEVTVMDEAGSVTRRGMAEFRAGYAVMFGKHDAVHAEVTERMALGRHVVERERWSRRDRESGAVSGGEVLVRYTEVDGLIRWVEFLRG